MAYKFIESKPCEECGINCERQFAADLAPDLKTEFLPDQLMHLGFYLTATIPSDDPRVETVYKFTCYRGNVTKTAGELTVHVDREESTKS